MSDCIFCKIARGEIPSQKVHEDEQFLAFRDIHSQAPTHILIIPKEHIPSLQEAEDRHGPLLGSTLLLARRLAEQEGLSEGYRVVNNCGPQGGQTVGHLHFHLLGGRDMAWPPG